MQASISARRRVIIQKALGADHDLEVVETSRRGHAARLARGAAAEGVEVVAVLAGDGTLNEAADGLVGTDTAIAPLPGGSTNVYARSLGIPDDPVEAAGELLDALDRKSFRRIGLGRIGRSGICVYYPYSRRLREENHQHGGLLDAGDPDRRPERSAQRHKPHAG